MSFKERKLNYVNYILVASKYECGPYYPGGSDYLADLQRVSFHVANPYKSSPEVELNLTRA